MTIVQIQLPIEELAAQIETEIGHLFRTQKPSMSGWYQKGRATPTLFDNKSYYILNRKQKIQVLDPNEFPRTNIYEYGTNRLVYEYEPLDSFPTFYTFCTIPTTGYFILQLFIQTQIQNHQGWKKRVYQFYDLIQPYLKQDTERCIYMIDGRILDPNITNLSVSKEIVDRIEVQRENDIAHYIDERVRGILQDLSAGVGHFLSRDHWMIHEIEINTTTGSIIIRKTKDYRISQWEQMHQLNIDQLLPIFKDYEDVLTNSNESSKLQAVLRDCLETLRDRH